MRTKNGYGWKCDFCNVEAVTESEYHPPEGWRVFTLFEQVKSPVNAISRYSKTLGDFSICCGERCSDYYKDMPPIRRALGLFARKK